MAAVEVRDLVVRYGDVTAVDGVSFTAAAGEVCALLGPNGAGKTSTIEVLEGFRTATAGTARVLGLDPGADHAALVARVGVMLQQGGVYPGIRVGEAAKLFASYYDAPLDTGPLLTRVGLAARVGATWKQLSGGEQQRLSLALALVGRPEVAFLDEPTSGVDVAGRQVIRALVRELAAGGVCVVVTTHELDEAERMADRVVIVDHGRVVGAGTPAELRTADATTIRFSATPGLDTSGLAAALAATVVEDRPGDYVVAAPADPATVAALTAWLADHGVALGDLRAGRQTLEDVFWRLTTGAGPATGTPPAPPAGRRRRRTGRP